MLTSFTKDEKKILLFLFALIGISSVITTVHDRGSEIPLLKGKRLKVAAPGLEMVTSPTAASHALSLPMRPDGKLDLNGASAEALSSIRGISIGLAEKIVQCRTERGKFLSVDELDEVPGIGPATLAKLRPFFYVSSSPEAQGPAARVATPLPTGGAGGSSYYRSRGSLNVQQVSMEPPRENHVQTQTGGIQPVPASSGPINLNTATLDELITLHRVGPVLAQRIIQYRQTNGPFRSVDDLVQIRGVGPKILQDNRHRLTVR